MASSSALVTVTEVADPARVRASRQLAPVCPACTPLSAMVTLTWKSPGPPSACPCGASRAVRRSGPPIDCPTDSASRTSDPAPAKASAPRREMVGGAGAGLTRKLASGGSVRVRAVLTRSSRSSPRSRSALITAGNFTVAWTANAATKTQAP
jgi:hypothetical protein